MQLLKNGDKLNTGNDHVPLVQLYLPRTKCTWLLTEIDPVQTNRAFGLCDLGVGSPELGYLDFDEYRVSGQPSHTSLLFRDMRFFGNYPISVYEAVAKQFGYIFNNPLVLELFSRLK